ncbi:MAG TPA: bifunctional alpha,alpha-trehalose-phosphate synthase (UDP-forming)/trehalose-phosphatase [Gemmatimonadales bacterium]|nr:bifunctional alpha,alpha-trehalose-phosphate synthase (UDP-forming)/trehalose-phosphatase [Gemmatimonadales bacterium]
MARTLIAANRLPLTAVQEDAEAAAAGAGGIVLRPSAGGLATGLTGVHDPAHDLWFGWSGLADEVAGGPALAELWRRHGCVPVPLSGEEVTAHYRDYSNGVIWPLFHSQIDRLPLRPGPWGVYERINERFADAIHAQLAPDDLVWIHDYQLMRVPLFLRRLDPHARIGFFLHIPFPPAEIFSALPERVEVLGGLLGADLIGFHTKAYRDNFAAAISRVLGASVERDVVRRGGVALGSREVRLGVFPMGIDVERFCRVAGTPAVAQHSARYLGAERSRILLGVDRLDYTKGIPRRLLAFERLLQMHPELRGEVRLVQLGVPSRGDVPAYRRVREQIDGLVGRINGSLGTPTWTPIHYIARSLEEDELIALYRASDVMVVTPLRDGMNLVAKEFVASRTDEDGVLVLSEFAGAAAELGDALLVNPYDIDRTARALSRALNMEPGERRARMRALRDAVRSSDVHRWAQNFLAALRAASAPGGAAAPPALAAVLPGGPHAGAAQAQQLIARARAARELVLLLDYDGTLVPIARTPAAATPDRELRALLSALARRPRTTVHIVSGRDRDTLAAWLGDLGVGLYAEHGLWWRPPEGGEWQRTAAGVLPRRAEIVSLLETCAVRVPGALVEQKTVGVAWHYRLADPAAAAEALHVIRAMIGGIVPDGSVELLEGSCVLEVRPSGINKGRVAARVLGTLPSGTLAIAMGDDRTDEQLFAAMPEGGISVHVGAGPTVADVQLATVQDARAFLSAIAAPAHVQSETRRGRESGEGNPVGAERGE